jgi:hypothetical protein
MSPAGANLGLLRTVAIRLGPIRDRVAFLGGSVVELLITDAGTAPPRPTTDVDVVTDVTSAVEYRGRLRDELRRLGFTEDATEGAPICRWLVDGVSVDIMPTSNSILGFSNPWYASALRHATRVTLPGGPDIRVVTAPHFLATKLAAFRNRGNEDYQASHDLEDCLAVVDGRSSIAADVAAAEDDLRSHLAREVRRLLANSKFTEALAGHLPGDPGSQLRLPTLTARLEAIARLA